MATIGHVAVGLAAARLHSRPSWVAAASLSALSLLPDADVLAFAFGIPYSHPFGHRGATHSFAFALLCGVAALAVRRSPRLGALVAVTVATHPLLDALTDGGLGVALLWPFSNERFFSPWQPLPVSPIGAGVASWRGLYVLGFEALAFLPLWVLALWPRRRRAPG